MTCLWQLYCRQRSFQSVAWHSRRGEGVVSLIGVVLTPSSSWHIRGWSLHTRAHIARLRRQTILHLCTGPARHLVALGAGCGLAPRRRRGALLPPGPRRAQLRRGLSLPSSPKNLCRLSAVPSPASVLVMTGKTGGGLLTLTFGCCVSAICYHTGTLLLSRHSGFQNLLLLAKKGSRNTCMKI